MLDPLGTLLLLSWFVGLPLILNSLLANRWLVWAKGLDRKRGLAFWVAGTKLTVAMGLVHIVITVLAASGEKVFSIDHYINASLDRPISRALDFTPLFPLLIAARAGSIANDIRTDSPTEVRSVTEWCETLAVVEELDNSAAQRWKDVFLPIRSYELRGGGWFRSRDARVGLQRLYPWV